MLINPRADIDYKEIIEICEYFSANIVNVINVGKKQLDLIRWSVINVTVAGQLKVI
jgi:hypothetical protein